MKLTPGFVFFRTGRPLVKLLTVILAGLLTAACLLETGLRISGWITQRAIDLRFQNLRAQASGKHVILCLGDSFTLGDATSPGFDWPSQLERLCRHRGFDVTTVNAGISSANTFIAIKALRDILPQLRPDIVLIMVHGNNWWFWYGFNRYLYGNTFRSRMQDHIQRIRVLKLFRLFWRQLAGLGYNNDPRTLALDDCEHLDARLGSAILRPVTLDTRPPEWTLEDQGIQQQARSFENAKKYAEALPFLLAITQRHPEKPDFCFRVSTCYVSLNRIEDALRFWDGILAIRRFMPRAAYSVPAMLAKQNGDLEQCAHFALLSIENNPDHESYYYLLYDIRHTLQGTPHMRRILDTLRRLAPQHEPARESLRFLERTGTGQDRDLFDWTVSQLRDMARLCRRYKCRLYFQEYPNSRHETVHAASKIEGVPLIDHHERFQRIPAPQRPGYFAPDDHPNERGYAVMAEEIFRAIQPDLSSAPAPGGNR